MSSLFAYWDRSRKRTIQVNQAENYKGLLGASIWVIGVSLSFVCWLGLWQSEAFLLTMVAPREGRREFFFLFLVKKNEKLGSDTASRAIEVNRGRDGVFFASLGWWVASFSPRFAIEITKTPATITRLLLGSLSYFLSTGQSATSPWVLLFDEKHDQSREREKKEQKSTPPKNVHWCYILSWILNGWSSSGRLTPCVNACYWRSQPSTLAFFLSPPLHSLIFFSVDK